VRAGELAKKWSGEGKWHGVGAAAWEAVEGARHVGVVAVGCETKGRCREKAQRVASTAYTAWETLGVMAGCPPGRVGVYTMEVDAGVVW